MVSEHAATTGRVLKSAGTALRDSKLQIANLRRPNLQFKVLDLKFGVEEPSWYRSGDESQEAQRAKLRRGTRGREVGKLVNVQESWRMEHVGVIAVALSS